MRKTVLYVLITAFILLGCSSCTRRDKVNDEAANKIKDAILAAENGESSGGFDLDTNFFLTDEEKYGYRLLTGNTSLPPDETALRAGIDLVRWWCKPAELYGEDTATAYQYVGVLLVNNEVECYDFAFGTYDDGEFSWKREFAVDFQAKRIFELNVNTLEYVEIYTAK